MVSRTKFSGSNLSFIGKAYRIPYFPAWTNRLLHPTFLFQFTMVLYALDVAAKQLPNFLSDFSRTAWMIFIYVY
jgi:hypothetical protein